jgi:penicillin-binding protein 1A
MAGWTPAGKTGTSQDFRDAWFVGYTGHLITGVWIGNDDSSAMNKATGSGLPVDIWARFMKTAHQGVPAAGVPVGDLLSRSTPDLRGMPPPVTPAALTRPNRGNELDFWSIDRLFGRR